MLGVVVLLFGTKKSKHFGSDLGQSMKGFQKAMRDEEKPFEPPPPHVQPTQEAQLGDPA
ncbi:twin-arginine translocase TatA/TatE family subunit [Pseudomonas alabamensis]|uniref:twin-arginine translocase TatA/TatE family subunit n=1 Tax=Pseudomonas alabamensis TaxID=3064349 RepID=UPI00351005DC